MFKHKYIDDIGIRCLKTFLQAFCGIALPEICVILNEGLPQGQTLWYVLFPILCSSLAAGISAAWNYLNNLLLKEEEEEESDERNHLE